MNRKDNIITRKVCLTNLEDKSTIPRAKRVRFKEIHLRKQKETL